VIQQFGGQRIDRLPTLLGAGCQPCVQIVGNAEEQLSHAAQDHQVLSLAAPQAVQGIQGQVNVGLGQVEVE
jgi:hypothetical protein